MTSDSDLGPVLYYMYYSSAADLTLLTQFTPEEMYIFSDNVENITFTKDEDKSVGSPILSF